MPKYIAILVTIFLIFLIGMTSFGAYLIYQRTLPTSVLTVSETSKKLIKPDEAMVNLMVDKTGESAAALNLENDKIIIKVVDYLVTSGVKKENIKSNKNSYEDYNYGPNGERGSKIIRMNSNIEVKFLNTEADINSILQQTLDLGINSFGQIDYRIKNQEKVCEELQTEAEQKLKQKIEQKTQNLGVKVVSIIYNSGYDNNCNGGGMYPMYKSAIAPSDMMGGGIVGENVLSGGQKELAYNASATVTYR
jgi:uncharacterized protein YggE